MTVWQTFAAAAARVPDNVAVEVQQARGATAPATTASWTYRQLHDAAVAHAAWLARQGVGSGDRCAILADNGPEWCAAYLGILCAGAVVVPLDTRRGSSGIAAAAGACGARVVYVDARLEGVARQAVAGRRGVIVTSIAASRADDPSTFAAATGTSDALAVILYTAGTTADPKGVVLTHANLLAARSAVSAVVHVGERDSVLGVLPLFHAFGQLATLLLPLLAGARVVFLETDSSAEITPAVRERRITLVPCAPQHAHDLHEQLMRGAGSGGMMRRAAFRARLGLGFRLRRLGLNAGPVLFRRAHATLGSEVRIFLVGGSLDPAVAQRFHALGFTILQAYALTEASGAAAISAPEDAHLGTVVRPLPGVDVCIMPPEHADLGGEIAIRGPIVMQGYYNRPDATAATLRDGWLLTGDLGRLDARGRLVVMGRSDDVIVLASGKKISARKVEAQYMRSLYVKEICVLAATADESRTGERLFAVVVPDMELMRQRRIANAGDLLRFEIEGQSIHLPPHERVLGYELWFEPLPRSATGELKRHEIAARLREKRHQKARGNGAQTTASLPADAQTEAILGAIRRRARSSAVDPDGSLELDLGLDSIERVGLLAELEHRFGVRISDGEAHHILTVSQLVEAFRSGEGGPPADGPEDAWAGILRDLPDGSDPVLGGLLQTRAWSRLLLFAVFRAARALLPRIEVTGLEQLPRRGPCIITPNHQSYLDPFFLSATLPFDVFRRLFAVGAAEYLETPFTSWLARQLSLVPVDPDANLVPAMKAGAFGLTQGRVLVLFPEGERSIDGTVKRFKKGAPILSRHLGVPIVPVAIRGMFEVWPRNRPLNWRVLLPWSGHRVRIAIGPPQHVEHSRYADAADSLRERVACMWESLDDGSREASTTKSTVG